MHCEREVCGQLDCSPEDIVHKSRRCCARCKKRKRKCNFGGTKYTVSLSLQPHRGAANGLQIYLQRVVKKTIKANHKSRTSAYLRYIDCSRTYNNSDPLIVHPILRVSNIFIISITHHETLSSTQPYDNLLLLCVGKCELPFPMATSSRVLIPLKNTFDR